MSPGLPVECNHLVGMTTESASDVGPLALPFALLIMLAGLLAGCADSLEKSTDFDRHRYSQLVRPYDRPDAIYFDVIFSPDYPAEDAAAEAVRLTWLAGWLEQRHLCPAGFEVAERRPFDYLEDNPARYEQRYVVRCKPAPTG